MSLVTNYSNTSQNASRTLAYPDGILQEKDSRGILQDSMIITINTDEKASKLRGDTATEQVYIPDDTRDGTGVNTGGLLTGQQIIDRNEDPGNIRTLFGDDVASTTRFRTQKGMRKLDKIIVLPMPNEYIVSTDVSYNPQYTPTTLTKLADVYSQLGNGGGADVVKYAKNAIISGVLNKMKSNLTNVDALLAEERMAMNPKKEVMFEGMTFRSFPFRFTLAPRTQAESETVKKIIETLRFYSLPEISSGRMFYYFPAEFNIHFLTGTNLNMNIPRIATSVLRRVSVNYSPNAVWATLPNHSPVQIDLSLEFLEVELIDRGRIAQSSENERSTAVLGF